LGCALTIRSFTAQGRERCDVLCGDAGRVRRRVVVLGLRARSHRGSGSVVVPCRCAVRRAGYARGVVLRSRCHCVSRPVRIERPVPLLSQSGRGLDTQAWRCASGRECPSRLRRAPGSVLSTGIDRRCTPQRLSSWRLRAVDRLWAAAGLTIVPSFVNPTLVGLPVGGGWASRGPKCRCGLGRVLPFQSLRNSARHDPYHDTRRRLSPSSRHATVHVDPSIGRH
jgi:hypothetical protein